MLRMGGNLRARAVAWWRRSHADPHKRDFRRAGLIAFGAVALSVLLARLTQDTAAAGAIRALAITVFALAAIALLGVVILMGEEVVEEMDAADPMRAQRGGAYGPRIKRFLRDAPRETAAWIAAIPGKIGGLRRDVTRESLSRMANASMTALSGVPPADAGPPPGAGRLARPLAEPPADANAAATDDRLAAGRRAPAPPRARRRALTASELTDRTPTTPRPTQRTGRSGARSGRVTDAGSPARD